MVGASRLPPPRFGSDDASMRQEAPFHASAAASRHMQLQSPCADSVVTAVTSGLVAKMEAAMLPCSSHLGGCRGSVGQLGGVEAQRLAAHASIWA